MQLSTKASLFLLLVTAIWGMTFPLIHLAVKIVSLDAFIFVRFGLAALLFLPLVYKKFRNTNKTLLAAGVLLGVTAGLSYLWQTYGLVTIPASRSAFITGMNVVIVPFLMPLFRLGKIKLIDGISVICCLIGLYVLTGASLNKFTVGDLWTIGAAIAYAFSIILIQVFSKKYNQPILLTFYQILFTIPLALSFNEAFHWPLFLNPYVLIALLFCSVLATCLVCYLQMRYQQYTTPTKAVLIYALEPVFATVFAFFINSEHITKNILIGGIIIIISTVLSDIVGYFKSWKHSHGV